jgi:WD40 repeat protein
MLQFPAQFLLAFIRLGFCLCAPLVAMPPLWAETANEPSDWQGPAEAVVAPTRIAWCCALSPDESWTAACYGHFQGDVGRLRVWDMKTGKVRWEARESRGIRRVAISPDGTLVASGNYGGEIHLRDATTGEVRKKFGGTGGSTECVSYSADGRQLVSCGNRRTVRIWDVTTGQMLKTLDGHTDAAYGAQFSPDGTLIVSHSRDRSVRIWNVADGSTRHVFSHPEEVYAAIFLAGGKRVATACADGQVRVFDADSGALVRALPPFSKEQTFATALAASGDARLLAAGDGTRIRIWDTANWEAVATLEEQRTLTWGLVFSRDAKTLISSGSDSSIRIWDVTTRKQRSEFPAPADETKGAGRVRALAIAPNGRLMAIADGSNQVELRPLATPDRVRKIDMGDAVSSIVFAPDGKSLATAGGALRLWDAEQGAPRGNSMGDASAVTWSPDGKRLASGSIDGKVCLWDPITAKKIATLEGHTALVLAVAFSPDGKRLVSGGADFTARIWDVDMQAVVAVLQGHAADVNAVAFTPDGKGVATASNDGSAKLWDASSFRQRYTLAHQEAVRSLAFSPDGQTLATGSEQGGIRLWNTARGTQRRRLPGHFGSVTAIDFLADGSGLLSGGVDQSVRLWRTAAPAVRALAMLPAHAPEALSAAFSPDGKWLITSGADMKVAIRDPAGGSIHRLLSGHTARVSRVAISPDSTLVASASGDGTVRVWSMLREEQVGMFPAWREKFAAARAVAFSADGRIVASGADDGIVKLWIVGEQKEVRVLDEQPLPVTGLAFYGGSLASSTGDWRNNQRPGELRLWEVASGRELALLKGHASEIKCVAIDPKGRLLASTASNGDVRLWDLVDRTELRTIRPDSMSGSLAFSSDGQWLAMGHFSGSVTLWDVRDGVLIERYVGHSKGVPGIAFSPDGKTIATTGTDGKLGLWPVAAQAATK